MKRVYEDKYLEHIAFPLGGMGAGMICIEGTGAFGSVSLRHRPDLFNEPYMYAALAVKGQGARLLEGPVQERKIWGASVRGFLGAGNGMPGKSYGLPRFRKCRFSSRFPFATVELEDHTVPLVCSAEAFSPFVPGNEDDSSLPCAAVTYRFENRGTDPVEAVFYFAALQFMGAEGGGDRLYVRRRDRGFVFEQEDTGVRGSAGAFCAGCDAEACVDTELYRGTWLAGQDTMTMLWNCISAGETPDRRAEDDRSPGALISAPFALEPGEKRSITLRLCWYVPESDLREGEGEDCYAPWYAGRFSSIYEAAEDFEARWSYLLEESRAFADAFCSGSLPEPVLEAAEANLSILKSPTVLRQKDGRFWGWEGVCDTFGSCYGSCTHVWNYAQALCDLFPRLERSLRETEYGEDQDEKGHQQFRTLLPIRPNAHNYPPAADGQPGGIMKLYREWRISGDTDWLRSLWPRAKSSMDYCIGQWDPEEQGVPREPHHNTYDIEFWGPDPMCSSFYLGALKAMSVMAEALGEDGSRYEDLYRKGRTFMETELWNGEYFFQQTEWKKLRAVFDPAGDPLLERMGPKYQLGSGCLSDGVCGAWLAKRCGLGDILDREKTLGHLESVYRRNLRKELWDHANPQRSGYALGKDGGLLLCSWPRGGKPEIPFPYSDEVWTGIEYQTAGHLASLGRKKEALEIVATARKRYDGARRNPYDEYECGHWYARALASWGLLWAFSGVSYDAVSRTLYHGSEDADVFVCAAGGYGIARIRDGKCSLEVVRGSIPVREYVRV
ncbi:MAG: hypothetical protein IK083_09590 [Abditibacteriota bacterium]|nr:hypothetical protein [Abditibacteriota bacterium]